MAASDDTELPLWGPLVLAYGASALRGPLEVVLRLDRRMGRLVSEVSEPALGQIRLAWWREEILRERPEGSPAPPDPLLVDILEHWPGDRQPLVELINGWEQLLAERPWGNEIGKGFARGRAACFAGLAGRVENGPAVRDAAAHGLAWGWADFALAGGSVLNPIVSLPRLPRSLRALAIIGGLSRRALTRGGAPLFGDRMSPLVAMRLGIFGT